MVNDAGILPGALSFAANRNVGCDDSGDAIKRPAHDGHTPPREQARHEDADMHSPGPAHVHTDCFLASGAKVLKGCDKYVVIAVSQKSFNSRTIRMGTSFGSPPLFRLPIVPHVS